LISEIKYCHKFRRKKRTNVHSCAYTFFIGYVIILVTIICKSAKVRLLGRGKRLSFTNFSLIDVLFKRSPRKEKANMEFKWTIKSMLRLYLGKVIDWKVK
jgi:hypothetical protein